MKKKALNQHHIDQPIAVSDHFTFPGHSINNIELIPLELINSNRDVACAAGGFARAGVKRLGGGAERDLVVFLIYHSYHDLEKWLTHEQFQS